MSLKTNNRTFWYFYYVHNIHLYSKKKCNHSSKLAALRAVLKFSKDESRDKQNPLEAGISGKSGIFSLALLNDSGPEMVLFYFFNLSYTYVRL